MSFHKKNLVLGALLLALLLVAAGLISIRQTGDRQPLRLSQPAGFYDDPIQVELRSDYGYEIFYTLDGSDPTRDSQPYLGPLTLADLSGQPNRYAGNAELSTGFLSELIEKHSYYHPDPHYVAPQNPVAKCTVLRAAAYSGTARMAQVTASYFIGYPQDSVYRQAMVVSLVSDPANLFDHTRGIYVRGQKFEEFLPVLEEEDRPFWPWWDGNYHIRGPESEREAHVEIFNRDGSPLLSSPCGIRTQGGGSRAKLPKSLGVYARTEYGGSETFDFPLFSQSPQPHKFVLFAGGDDGLCNLYDYLIQSLAAGQSFSTMEFYPCVVFLDGEFWGACHIIENYNDHYIQDHYDVPKDDVVIIKAGELAEGRATDLSLYESMRRYITENDMAVEENYRQACQLIDIESFADYYASQIYIARTYDWPSGNMGLWRSRSGAGTTAYQDGRWRWMLYDVNSGGLTLDLVHSDTLDYARKQDPVFDSLCANGDFQLLMTQRLIHMATQVYSQERVDTFLNQYLETRLPAMAVSSQRFYGLDRTDEITARVEDIRTFFAMRRDYADAMLEKHFGNEFEAMYDAAVN